MERDKIHAVRHAVLFDCGECNIHAFGIFRLDLQQKVQLVVFEFLKIIVQNGDLVEKFGISQASVHLIFPNLRQSH